MKAAIEKKRQEGSSWDSPLPWLPLIMSPELDERPTSYSFVRGLRLLAVSNDPWWRLGNTLHAQKPKSSRLGPEKFPAQCAIFGNPCGGEEFHLSFNNHFARLVKHPPWRTPTLASLYPTQLPFNTFATVNESQSPKRRGYASKHSAESLHSYRRGKPGRSRCACASE